MSTHSRLCSTIDDNEPNRLPLICDSDHPLSKEIELLVKNYDNTLYRRNSEEAIQRVLAMNEGLRRAGRILHCNRNKEENLLYDSDCDLDLDIGSNDESKRNRTDGMEEEKRAMSDDNGNPKAPDYWSGHDPQVLSLRFPDPASDFAIKEAKAFKPVMNKFGTRWPFALVYLEHLKTYMDTAEHMHSVRNYD
ncbi:hypothetical protein FGSG_09139 [Fusarium graminearum PH-1]|uniref:hypothetical protein n=1 Tax=Gibberella zeae (strain ATCC MYA-4620 / CBS 123657 / FGSC 9075 / NRRL 31084 / PH-1) TaxID=229533 RepID=UPI000023D8FF|nr:hypothetical protein FGSG_09139 [Fusarium graminearum PH-1]ESU15669.1 hypothetical protein FGSG_09139 [Fusarium graminearum PH-1]|eukprot:XP_011328647.1 hypothetical protein FGSG_09139 [Fusarium graminearum PH-1]